MYYTSPEQYITMTFNPVPQAGHAITNGSDLYECCACKHPQSLYRC